VVNVSVARTKCLSSFSKKTITLVKLCFQQLYWNGAFKCGFDKITLQYVV